MSGTAAALHTDQDGSSHTSTPSTPRQHQSSIVQPPLPPQPHYDVADFAKLYTATHSGQGDAPGSSSTGGSSSATAPLNDPLKNLSILSQEAGMNAGASAVGAQTSFLYIQLQAQLAAYQSSTAQNYAAAGYPGYHWPNYSTAANASAVAASQFAAAAGWHSMAAAGTYGMYPGWMGPRPGGKKGRMTYHRQQTMMLETEFRSNRYITKRRRLELQSQIFLTDRQIKIWFQNRRMKEKKEKKRVQEEAELARATSDSTDAKRPQQVELQASAAALKNKQQMQLMAAANYGYQPACHGYDEYAAYQAVAASSLAAKPDTSVYKESSTGAGTSLSAGYAGGPFPFPAFAAAQITAAHGHW